MEKFIHTPKTPVKSWDGLRSAEHQEILEEAPKMRKNILIVVAALASALAFSSCWDKSVDQKVLDVIKDAQEQVDDLSQEEAELVKELKEVRIDKSQAEDELRKANILKR